MSFTGPSEEGWGAAVGVPKLLARVGCRFGAAGLPSDAIHAGGLLGAGLDEAPGFIDDDAIIVHDSLLGSNVPPCGAHGYVLTDAGHGSPIFSLGSSSMSCQESRQHTGQRYQS
jgi:hypothetical protein